MDSFELLKKLAEGTKEDRQKHLREVYRMGAEDISNLLQDLSSVPLSKEQGMEEEFNDFGIEALPVYIASLILHASILYSKEGAEIGKLSVTEACFYNASYLCMSLRMVMNSMTTTVCGQEPQWEKKN